jgi:predicted nucleic acid-binding Zn ribbon protein
VTRPRLPDEPIEPGLHRLRDALSGVVSSLKPEAPERPGGRSGGVAAGSLGGLFRGWTEAVGEQVAAHVRPVVLDGGRLVVEVDEPAWATQLQFLERDLLDRVRPLVAPAPLTSLDVRVRGVRKGRGSRKT